MNVGRLVWLVWVLGCDDVGDQGVHDAASPPADAVVADAMPVDGAVNVPVDMAVDVPVDRPPADAAPVDAAPDPPIVPLCADEVGDDLYPPPACDAPAHAELAPVTDPRALAKLLVGRWYTCSGVGGESGTIGLELAADGWYYELRLHEGRPVRSPRYYETGFWHVEHNRLAQSSAYGGSGSRTVEWSCAPRQIRFGGRIFARGEANGPPPEIVELTPAAACAVPEVAIALPDTAEAKARLVGTWTLCGGRDPFQQFGDILAPARVPARGLELTEDGRWWALVDEPQGENLMRSHEFDHHGVWDVGRGSREIPSLTLDLGPGNDYGLRAHFSLSDHPRKLLWRGALFARDEPLGAPEPPETWPAPDGRCRSPDHPVAVDAEGAALRLVGAWRACDAGTEGPEGLVLAPDGRWWGLVPQGEVWRTDQTFKGAGHWLVERGTERLIILTFDEGGFYQNCTLTFMSDPDRFTCNGRLYQALTAEGP